MKLNSTPPPARVALRTLLIVLAIALGAAIYSYGWTVTNIDLRKPQEPSRLSHVSRALQELLSPRIFEQDREVTIFSAPFVINCPEGGAAEAQSTTDGTPYVVVSPACGQAGDIVTVTAANFPAGVDARVRWQPPEGQARPRNVLETGREEITVSESGTFTGQIEVPRMSAQAGEVHQVELRAAVPTGTVRVSDIMQEVLRRMAETIFMALVATTLAIPISVILSFFAAHNLMKPIRMPTGNLMAAIIALPVGWWVGTTLLGFIGRIGLDLGQGNFANLINAGATLPVFLVGTTVATNAFKLKPDNPLVQLRTVLGQFLAVIIVVFVFGLLGGIGISASVPLNDIGNSFRPDTVTNLGQWLVNAGSDAFYGVSYLLGIIGGIIDLTIVPIAGVLGAFTASSATTRLTRDFLRQMPVAASHILGGVLGFFSGAIIMFLVASISITAALLSLLTPLAATLIAGQIVHLIYRQQVIEKRQYRQVYSSDKFAMSVLNLLVSAIVFVVTVIVLGIARMVIDGTLPSAAVSNVAGIQINTFVFNAMQIGAILGLIWGAIAGTRAPFPIGDLLYNMTRNILNTTRSIEPLIMALIFVIWVGIGPFAGVLALTLHSIASLGKLYSEQIETIDAGPIEALQATGANHLQTIVYAVIPQIIPPYIAYTMYRWDINVRMSTIIGFVGGGGIGLLLSQQINLVRYRDAGVAVLAIAVVVSVLDYASASIRERVM